MAEHSLFPPSISRSFSKNTDQPYPCGIPKGAGQPCSGASKSTGWRSIEACTITSVWHWGAVLAALLLGTGNGMEFSGRYIARDFELRAGTVLNCEP